MSFLLHRRGGLTHCLLFSFSSLFQSFLALATLPTRSYTLIVLFPFRQVWLSHFSHSFSSLFTLKLSLTLFPSSLTVSLTLTHSLLSHSISLSCPFNLISPSLSHTSLSPLTQFLTLSCSLSLTQPYLLLNVLSSCCHFHLCLACSSPSSLTWMAGHRQTHAEPQGTVIKNFTPTMVGLSLSLLSVFPFLSLYFLTGKSSFHTANYTRDKHHGIPLQQGIFNSFLARFMLYCRTFLSVVYVVYIYYI